MSVIIDQFEVIMDSQNQQQEKRSSDESQPPQQQGPLKPHTIATVLEQLQGRTNRVRAH